MKIFKRIIIILISFNFSCVNEENIGAKLPYNCFSDFYFNKISNENILIDEEDASLSINISDYSNFKKDINDTLILENELFRILKIRLYNSYKCLKENEEVLNIKKYNLSIKSENINSENIYFDSIFYNLNLSEIKMNTFAKVYNSSNNDLNKVLAFYSPEILLNEKEELLEMLNYTKNDLGEIILGEIKDFGYFKVNINNDERILLRIIVEGKFSKIETRSQFVFDYFVDKSIEFLGFYFMEYKGYIEID